MALHIKYIYNDSIHGEVIDKWNRSFFFFAGILNVVFTIRALLMHLSHNLSWTLIAGFRGVAE